jgi:hypothetical protein
MKKPLVSLKSHIYYIMLVLNQIPAGFPFVDVLIADLGRTCCRLFQKRVMCTKFDIYVFIYSNDNSHIC